MSKKSNIWTMEEVHKKKIDIMRFTHIDINFDVKYDGNQKPQNVHRKFFDQTPSLKTNESTN